MNYLITVYITNYNYGEYIETAISSVLGQTLKDFELIIIDDGSTDDSKSIIEKYKDNDHIKIIYQQNKGLNVTNNIALRAASGKYIMRLDADDYLKEDALEILSSKLEADEALGLVFGDYYLVDKHGKILSEEKRHDFDSEVKLFDQPAHGACTMIRTNFLKAVGGYNESYNCQDGYELWVKFISRFKVTNVSVPIFYYRQHGNNLTSNEDKILNTRAAINASFVRELEHDTSAIAIIPVRGGDGDVSLKELNGQTLLNIKIEQALGAQNIQKVIVTSPKESVRDAIYNHKKVEFHHRKESEARYNQTLNPTVKDIINSQLTNGLSFESVALLTIEYPFLKPHKIDDAINTLHLFGSDSLISVRPDNSIFYQHHGDGLHAILNRDKYTKLEREALFKQAGGISITRKSTFLETEKFVSGTLGHMVVDQKSAIGIFSVFDFKLAEILASTEEAMSVEEHE